MAIRDDLGNLCHYEIGLQLYSIAVPKVGEFTALRNAQRVYGQYGICIKFITGQSLALSRKQQVDLSIINGTCNWSTLSEDQRQLHNLRDNYATSPYDIRVYFVNEIREENDKILNGCGGYAPGRPAVTIAAIGSPWTFAHELGHVLLGSGFKPVHTDDKANLMYKSTNGITANPPTLTPAQLTAIKASKYCRIPVEDIPPVFWLAPKRRSSH
jgi:hypothetical protein